MPSSNANEKIKVVPTDDLDRQKKVTRQNQLENIRFLRGRFKGSLSSSEDFAARKALGKKLELICRTGWQPVPQVKSKRNL